jgi:hypothetical protein
MPTIATSQLPIPKDWNEFEDICADLFSLIWNDHNTVRYGRAGQRQNGVDIRREGGYIILSISGALASTFQAPTDGERRRKFLTGTLLCGPRPSE